MCVRTLNRFEKCTYQQPNMQILTHNTRILILTWLVFQLVYYSSPVKHKHKHFLLSVYYALRVLPKEYLFHLPWHMHLKYLSILHISHSKFDDWNPFDVDTATKRPFTNVHEIRARLPSTTARKRIGKKYE